MTAVCTVCNTEVSSWRVVAGQPQCMRCSEGTPTLEEQLAEARAKLATALEKNVELAGKNAVLRTLCVEVDMAIGNTGIAETAILTRARLRGAAGLAQPPTPEQVARFAGYVGLDFSKVARVDNAHGRLTGAARESDDEPERLVPNPHPDGDVSQIPEPR